MSDLAGLSRKLERLANGIDDPRVIKAAGMAAKRATLDVARDVSGGDGKLSGWGRNGLKLGAGYDQTGPHEVTIHLRPAGPWQVMEEGRRGGGTIVPRSRGRGRNRTAGRALMTPWGPRASVRGSSSRGKSAITKAAEKSSDESTRAAQREVTQIMREVWS